MSKISPSWPKSRCWQGGVPSGGSRRASVSLPLPAASIPWIMTSSFHLPRQQHKILTSLSDSNLTFRVTSPSMSDSHYIGRTWGSPVLYLIPPAKSLLTGKVTCLLVPRNSIRMCSSSVDQYLAHHTLREISKVQSRMWGSRLFKEKERRNKYTGAFEGYLESGKSGCF